MHRNFCLVALAVAMVSFPWVATPIAAHHAVQAQFDQDNVTQITGVLTRVM
jgi:hypothetical protein